MRIAIVHYWLLGMRGGEKVVEALCRLFPDADIFTLFYDPNLVSPVIRSRVVKASFLNPLRRHYRCLLPLMPMALEHLDLRGYDLIISSESGPAKGVITSSETRHVCYCHSPMRYLWDLYPAYLHDWTHSTSKRALIILFSNYLRLWDYAAAARVDDFIANSNNIKRRIWKAYRRTSEVIYPPVPVESFYVADSEDYYLMVSELVPYKRLDYAVRCLSKMKRRLKVVGDGPEYTRLTKLASSDVEFCGRVSPAELRKLYSRSRAVIFPGEEDFGIVPVEALASGKAVIALRRGGVIESVPQQNPRAGFFYDIPDDASLESAIHRFEQEKMPASAVALQAAASRFSEDRFHQEVQRLLFGPQEQWQSNARSVAHSSFG